LQVERKNPNKGSSKLKKIPNKENIWAWPSNKWKPQRTESHSEKKARRASKRGGNFIGPDRETTF